MKKPSSAPPVEGGAFPGRLIERIHTFVRGPNGWKAILWAGLIGLGLICLSNIGSVYSGGGSVTSAEEWDAATYTAALEQRLTDMLEQMAGVGECRVMITLENAREYVYTDRHEVVTEVQPTVKGVMVVCAGAEDQTVAERVQTAVQTVLHVASRRVCVTPAYQ